MNDIERPESYGGEERGEEEAEVIEIEDADMERLSRDRGLMGFALGVAVFEAELHREHHPQEPDQVVELFRTLYQGKTFVEAAKIHPQSPKDFKYYVSLVAGEYFGSQENYQKEIVSDKYRARARQGSIVTEGAIYDYRRRSAMAISSKIKGAKDLVDTYKKVCEKAVDRARLFEIAGKDQDSKAA